MANPRQEGLKPGLLLGFVLLNLILIVAILADNLSSSGTANAGFSRATIPAVEVTLAAPTQTAAPTLEINASSSGKPATSSTLDNTAQPEEPTPVLPEEVQDK
jgi:hypothetical protein